MPNSSAQDPLQPPAKPGASPTPEPPDTPASDPAVYGGQWGGDAHPKPGLPPTDRPGRIEPPAEKN